jgi:hypothetical protein
MLLAPVVAAVLVAAAPSSTPDLLGVRLRMTFEEFKAKFPAAQCRENDGAPPGLEWRECRVTEPDSAAHWIEVRFRSGWGNRAWSIEVALKNVLHRDFEPRVRSKFGAPSGIETDTTLSEQTAYRYWRWRTKNWEATYTLTRQQGAFTQDARWTADKVQMTDLDHERWLKAKERAPADRASRSALESSKW